MGLMRTKIQITSVDVGTFGGAIFRGLDIKTNRKIKCIASYKILTRTPEFGEFWYVEGSIITHPKYGDQLRLSKCSITDLPSPRYLSSLLIRHPQFRGFGLGKAKVDTLIEKVGSELLLIELLDQGKYLYLADYVAEPICKVLCERWQPLQNEMALARFLTEHEFSSIITKQITRICRDNAVEKLESNPYALLAFAPTSPKLWRTVETISLKLGFRRDSQERLVGAIEHTLYTALRSGDTALPGDELLARAYKLLGSKTNAKNGIEAACKVRAICSFKTESNDIMFQTIGAALIEANVEEIVSELANSPLQADFTFQQLPELIDKYNSTFHSEQGYTLTEEQQAAVRMVFEERISVVTGFGGTGKTTILKAVADVAELLGLKIYLMALAGKAKDRIEQATGLDDSCYTIHGFVKAVKEKSDSVDLNGTPIIVIDEASMVDIALANRLLNQIKNKNYHIVLVGDPAQLSPVGFGIFFHALVDKIKTIKLTKVHRQTAQSPVHQMAMKIREGTNYPLPLWNGESEGVYFLSCQADQKDIINVINRIMPHQRCQIITPHSSYLAADNTHSINKAMQFLLNASSTDVESGGVGYDNYTPHFRIADTYLLENDPIIVTNNNYEKGLYNGNTGIVEEIVNNEGMMFARISVGSKVYLLTKDDCFELGIELAYATTIHKSQGSEYDSVIVCCAVPSKLLERSMVYTALTRSKKLTIFIGSLEVLNKAISGLPRAETINYGFQPKLKVV
ncbi:ATP-dependent DNA helicase [Cognaticolwellia beringensis]|uniref:Uncharacterized protein n=1 Tax=Cognaticolwellia beringensis TaxID=1967665 RepID=A0A222G5Q3_9GAMM|nr:ATP-dependent RecD-like DNA helicase [Cognaticolwellia beringensis]ASP46684.1 hypothetical protein B5D82_02130 [Cognaticolwellia beringensis]